MKKKISGIIVMMLVLFTGCGSVEADNISAEAVETEEFLLENVDTGSLTDADKKEKYIAYLEAVFEKDIVETYPAIKSAEVTLSEEENTMKAVVSLDLQEEIADDSVSEIAEVVATAIGDTSTDNITIQDSEGTLLFR